MAELSGDATFKIQVLTQDIRSHEHAIDVLRRRIIAVKLHDEGKPVTKWDLITEDERVTLDCLPFTANGTGACSACGTTLATEGDFARHFIVPDVRFYNLGECPNKPRG